MTDKWFEVYLFYNLLQFLKQAKKRINDQLCTKLSYQFIIDIMNCIKMNLFKHIKLTYSENIKTNQNLNQKCIITCKTLLYVFY